MRRPFSIAAAVMVTIAACLLARDYEELYRPQFHFSPRMNWTNDPCGLVYAFGKFHLFFQHNPFENKWGHMSWGHAVSSDLVRWNQLPVAIPDDSKAAIFTGSSVFDSSDTSGLCTSGQGCIVSIYTGMTPKTETSPEKQTENLAFSQDGLTWTKYSGNPVLDLGRSDTRDPKVFWYAPGKYWVMVIVQANDKKVRLFRSLDLKHWSQLSEFGPQGATGGVWECPDLYQLPVAGHPGTLRWILKIGLNPGHIAGGSGEQYFIGQFDGRTFTPDDPKGAIRWLDYGRDCYCALTFNNDHQPGTPHMIGWMNNWQYAADAPTSPWRGSMTLPRELSLAGLNGSLQLLQQPVRELASLRSRAFSFAGSSVDELNRKLTAWPYRSRTFELETTIHVGAAHAVGWRLLEGGGTETVVAFDVVKQELFVDRSKSGNTQWNPAFPSRTAAPLRLGSEPLKLHVFVDRSSVEVFAQDGAVTMTNLVFPRPDSTGLSLTATGGSLENMQVRLWTLQPAWQEKQ
ncbi:MAG: glycoside hydrolase family 32 protein [Acidobacteriaceae bacterium]|nr:glycoside hydrolase family 32 protein [Acidobacteriaceae bacterium]